MRRVLLATIGALLIAAPAGAQTLEEMQEVSRYASGHNTVADAVLQRDRGENSAADPPGLDRWMEIKFTRSCTEFTRSFTEEENGALREAHSILLRETPCQLRATPCPLDCYICNQTGPFHPIIPLVWIPCNRLKTKEIQ